MYLKSTKFTLCGYSGGKSTMIQGHSMPEEKQGTIYAIFYQILNFIFSYYICYRKKNRHADKPYHNGFFTFQGILKKYSIHCINVIGRTNTIHILIFICSTDTVHNAAKRHLIVIIRTMMFINIKMLLKMQQVVIPLRNHVHSLSCNSTRIRLSTLKNEL